MTVKRLNSFPATTMDIDSSDEEIEEINCFVSILQAHTDMIGAAAAAASASAAMMESDDSSSEDDRNTWGGSRVGKQPNKKRDFEGAMKQVMEHYFSGSESVYNETDFERRFGVPRDVFFQVYHEIVGQGTFIRKYNPVSFILFILLGSLFY